MVLFSIHDTTMKRCSLGSSKEIKMERQHIESSFKDGYSYKGPILDWRPKISGAEIQRRSKMKRKCHNEKESVEI